MHKQGIVHGDLSQEVVFMREIDGRPDCYIVDKIVGFDSAIDLSRPLQGLASDSH